jgi:hypothetical protein
VRCGPVADFNGDGFADILWQTTSGSLSFWLMDGIGSHTSVNHAGFANYTVATARDFDGDGKADILWRQTAGDGVTLWEMKGAQIRHLKNLPVRPSSWTVQP